MSLPSSALPPSRATPGSRWELIVVDNGSTDGTGTYLAGLRDMSTVPVTVVSNATNVGFPAAINQGLRLARGEYLVMLNNDVVVTDGWLDQLITLTRLRRNWLRIFRIGMSRASIDLLVNGVISIWGSGLRCSSYPGFDCS